MRRWVATTTAMLVVLAIVTPTTVSARSDDELERVREEIAALNGRIKEAKTEQSRVAAQLAAVQARLDDVLVRLREVEGRVAQVEAAIAGEEQDLAALTERMRRIEDELRLTKLRLATMRDEVRRQAISMYMNASGGTAGMVLELEDTSDLVVSLAYADDVLGRGQDVITSYEILRREEERQQEAVAAQQALVEERIAALATKKAELEQDRAEVEALRAEVEDDLHEAKALLESIQQEIRDWEDHKESLEEESKRLEEEIRRSQSTGGTNPGVLGWPLNGRVTSLFGPRVHPIFGNTRMHRGIDIAAPYGTPIVAAGDGTVILASVWGGFGKAVVIDHGGGLTTVYAHQSRIAVSVGQKVKRGQVIGYVGCTGYCTGPNTHFETRESGTPVDPMKYLGSR